MSISIYYTAKRSHPLTAEEAGTISRLITEYSVEQWIERYGRTGLGLNWDSFGQYDPGEPSEPGIVFEGATKLPDNSEDAIWQGLQHWSRLLAEIRRSVGDADWQVQVEDHDLVWDEGAGEYDLQQ